MLYGLKKCIGLQPWVIRNRFGLSIRRFLKNNWSCQSAALEGGDVWANAGQPLVCDVNSLPHQVPQCVFTVVTHWIFLGDAVMCQVLLGRRAQAKNRGCPASCLHPHQLTQVNSNITRLPILPPKAARLYALSHMNPLWLLHNLCGHFIYCLGVFQAENLEWEWPFAHSSCWFIAGSVRVSSRCWWSWHETISFEIGSAGKLG